MTTINLKDFYPWYTHDEYIEVSEEVADELRASRLYEAAYSATASYIEKCNAMSNGGSVHEKTEQWKRILNAQGFESP